VLSEPGLRQSRKIKRGIHAVFVQQLLVLRTDASDVADVEFIQQRLPNSGGVEDADAIGVRVLLGGIVRDFCQCLRGRDADADRYAGPLFDGSRMLFASSGRLRKP
jgi:hypothetical protein